MSVPVVDFSACSLAEQIHAPEASLSAQQVGFVFLENTGISQEEVSRSSQEM